MSSADIVDSSVRVLQVIVGPLWRYGLPALMLAIGSLLVSYQIFFPRLFVTRDASNFELQASEVVATLSIMFALAMPVYLIGIASFTILVSRLTADAFQDREVNGEAAAHAARERIWPVFLLLLRIGWMASLPVIATIALILVAGLTDELTAMITSTISFFLMIVSFFWVPTVFWMNSLAPVVAALEGLRGRDALRRGRALAAGGGLGSTLLVFFLSGFLLLLLAGGLLAGYQILGLPEAIVTFITHSWLAELVETAINILPVFVAAFITTPILVAGLTVVYFDRRVRREGYDIEVLAGHARQAVGQSRFHV